MVLFSFLFSSQSDGKSCAALKAVPDDVLLLE